MWGRGRRCRWGWRGCSCSLHVLGVGRCWFCSGSASVSLAKIIFDKHFKIMDALAAAMRLEQTPEALRNPMNIRYCALSLVGEPMIYTEINRNCELLHRSRIAPFMSRLRGWGERGDCRPTAIRGRAAALQCSAALRTDVLPPHTAAHNAHHHPQNVILCSFPFTPLSPRRPPIGPYDSNALLILLRIAGPSLCRSTNNNSTFP